MARISVPAEAFLVATHEAYHGVLTARVLVAEVLCVFVHVHAVGFYQLEAGFIRVHVAGYLLVEVDTVEHQS